MLFELVFIVFFYVKHVVPSERHSFSSHISAASKWVCVSSSRVKLCGRIKSGFELRPKFAIVNIQDIVSFFVFNLRIPTKHWVALFVLVYAEVRLLTCLGVLHRLCAYPYPALVLQLDWDLALSELFLVHYWNNDWRIRLSGLVLDEQVILVFIKHIAIMRSTFGNGLGLVDLHLLHPPQTILSSRISSSAALRRQNSTTTASGLHVSSRWNSISESLRIKPRSCVVHVFNVRSISLGAHQLVLTSASWICYGCVVRRILAFFVDYCHSVEVVVG